MATLPRPLTVALMTALLLVVLAPQDGTGPIRSAWTATPSADPADAVDPGRAATSGTAPGAVDRTTTFTTMGAALAASDPAALIPTAALGAYHRAASVMERAAPRCQLTWSLLAGLGGALTDHGRLGGEHRLTSAGRARPAIVGDPLLDARGRSLADSDRGELDGDLRHDRTVGPLLVSPSGWRTVGVDADSDQRRDPQDIDDAALATAVLLCTSGRDLARPPDQRSALLEVHADPVLVDTALTLARTYGAATSTPPPLTRQPWSPRPAVPSAPTTPSGTAEIRAGSPATPSGPSTRPSTNQSEPSPVATPAAKPEEKPGTKPGQQPGEKPASTSGATPMPTATTAPPEQQPPSDPDTCSPEVESDPTEDPSEDPTGVPTEQPTAPPTERPTVVADGTTDVADEDIDEEPGEGEDGPDGRPATCESPDPDQSAVSY